MIIVKLLVDPTAPQECLYTSMRARIYADVPWNFRKLCPIFITNVINHFAQLPELSHSNSEFNGKSETIGTGNADKRLLERSICRVRMT